MSAPMTAAPMTAAPEAGGRRSGRASAQEAVLRALALGHCQGPEEIAPAAGLPPKGVTGAICHLIRRGWALRRERGCYELTPEGLAAREAGTAMKSGPSGPLSQRHARRPRRVTLQDLLWRGLRIRGKATACELLQLADREGLNALLHTRQYLGQLTRAGYLRRLPPDRSSGHPRARWLLVDDSGPLAPSVRRGRRSIYDPNRDEERPLPPPAAGAAKGGETNG